MTDLELEDIEQALVCVSATAVAAGEAIINLYDQDIEVFTKEDSSPLTQADLAANQVIVQALSNLPIGNAGVLPILSEESEQIPFEQRQDWDLFWLVDPLDGTKEFLNKNGEFTVNIALIQSGIPVAGVIYLPVFRSLYLGLIGSGSYLLNIDELGECRLSEISFQELTARCLTLGDQSNEKQEFTVIGTRSHVTPEYEEYLDKLRSKHAAARFISAGSSLKFCRIAEGFADVYPRLGPTMEWDTAAGHAIVSAIGKSVTVWGTEQELQYNKRELVNPWFLVE